MGKDELTNARCCQFVSDQPAEAADAADHHAGGFELALARFTKAFDGGLPRVNLLLEGSEFGQCAVVGHQVYVLSASCQQHDSRLVAHDLAIFHLEMTARQASGFAGTVGDVEDGDAGFSVDVFEEATHFFVELFVEAA